MTPGLRQMAQKRWGRFWLRLLGYRFVSLPWGVWWIGGDIGDWNMIEPGLRSKLQEKGIQSPRDMHYSEILESKFCEHYYELPSKYPRIFR
jgi:hypothetical protein